MTNTAKTILVIEDEDLLLQAICNKLKIEGLQTMSCTSGEQALDYLKSVEELPDLIWLDYHLTGMDGLSFMQALKREDKFANIPVIVVSNSASDDKVKNILALGANKYLLKAEHRLDEIIATAQELIK